jgi:hypothetical protein
MRAMFSSLPGPRVAAIPFIALADVALGSHRVRVARQLNLYCEIQAGTVGARLASRDDFAEHSRIVAGPAERKVPVFPGLKELG